jgi:hypothetical protein
MDFFRNLLKNKPQRGDSMAKAMSLLKAYLSETIPPNGAFIITALFEHGTAYAIYEITASVSLRLSSETTDVTIIFQDVGNATHACGTASIRKKIREPVNGESRKSMPYRLSDGFFNRQKKRKNNGSREPSCCTRHSPFLITRQ